jgi:hypothetical protein
MVLRSLVFSVLAAFGASAALVACSGNDKGGVSGGSKLPGGARGAPIEHESCDEKSNRVEEVDVNGDGKNDIRRVYDKKSNREVCRVVDLNKDGKPDLYEYFDGAGTVRRREYCYSDDGVVNAIEYFENGKTVRREYDTTGQHRVDTWDFFDPAQPPDPKTRRLRPVRRERDTNGDGAVDQWWSWEGDKVTILVDKNSDGKPDPEGSITLGGGAEDAGAEAAAPPPASPASTDDAASPLAPVSHDDAGAHPMDAGGGG